MTKAAERLSELLGDKVTTDAFERSFYARDLAPVPGFLSRTIFQNTPEIVVRPTSQDDIVAVMKIALEEKIPVTARAGATTAFLNAVPVKGGIVLDTTGLKGILDIDEKNRWVKALPGTSWKKIDEELMEYGLTACSLPSSAEASTAGGWFNMEGYGIGSVKYGGFHDQVQSAQLVLAGGRIIRSEKEGEYPLSWFAGSEGTLGIVSELEFQVREAPEYTKNYALEYDTVSQVQEALEMTHKWDGPDAPYHVHWSNGDFHEFLDQLGYHAPIKNNLLLVTYQGNQAQVHRGEQMVKDLMGKTQGKWVDEETADAEWADRFRAMRIKRGGPTLLAAEVLLPSARLAHFCAQLAALGQRAAVYGHLLDRGRINILVMYHADETKVLEYLFLMAKTKKIYDAALGLGGRPYGFGAWNSLYLTRAYDQDRIQSMKEHKKMLDPLGIVNPGKVLDPPKVLNPRLFGLGTGSANLISGVLGIGRGR
ncbi:FAD-binding oxidoreductase [Candidatus Formimonas warabiya]|uniref:D-lactate dehydrogenase (cytochrome) n=1 Tax=Formimonas warabiya TaxID=1761012 RepID=A0A3G1KUK9_FORW1|nr:FAD-binding oxidoreductase [Candidatus Formimonas warabiya]ATW25875.1 hypothetical protein DCMF_14830 [Candidatus Formimonas warabiya]